MVKLTLSLIECQACTLSSFVLSSLKLYVEDKTSCNGPMPLMVNPKVTVAELKDLVQSEFEIPAGAQRWILDKTLVEDDSQTLSSLGINQNDQKIFLYLIVPGRTHH